MFWDFDSVSSWLSTIERENPFSQEKILGLKRLVRYDGFLIYYFLRRSIEAIMSKRKSHNKNSTTLLREVDVERKWYIFDAEGKTLGRFASEVTKVLRGKNKPTFTRNIDCGDGVIIINADKIYLSGSKEVQKEYHRYTGHIGGLKTTTFEEMIQRHPTRVLQLAISRMLPRTRLRQRYMKRLKIYAGEAHDHQAQKPIKANI